MLVDPGDVEKFKSFIAQLNERKRALELKKQELIQEEAACCTNPTLHSLDLNV